MIQIMALYKELWSTNLNSLITLMRLYRNKTRIFPLASGEFKPSLHLGKAVFYSNFKLHLHLLLISILFLNIFVHLNPPLTSTSIKISHGRLFSVFRSLFAAQSRDACITL